MQPEDKIEKHFKLISGQKKALYRLGLKTIKDLLFYFPKRYENYSQLKTISSLKEGDSATVYGQIIKINTKKAFRSKIPMSEGVLEDSTGKIKIIWFNQPYIAKMFPKGTKVKLTGKIEEKKTGLQLLNPEIEKAKDLPIDTHDSLFFQEKKEIEAIPVYGSSQGLTSRWLYHALKKILAAKAHLKLSDPLPKEVLKKYNLPEMEKAMVWIHLPRKHSDAEAAKKRFAFQEVFLVQLNKQTEKLKFKNKTSFKIKIDKDDVEEFTNRFPFKLTGSQKKAIKEINQDLNKKEPMARLLEGDVGSGKTAVAATIAYAIINNHPKDNRFRNLQVAYMAPTEILANQHFESFIEYFQDLNINIGLLTSKVCKKFPAKTGKEKWTNISKNQLLKWVSEGQIPILVGTHSLIQKSVKFKELGLAIIDEQHRFGTAQRAMLTKKSQYTPHLLSMTATPIPRTLALTIYGDLDLTLIDQMPAGRKKAETKIVPPNEREKTYEKIEEEIEKGRQAYIICPRIQDPDPDEEKKLIARSVRSEAIRLTKRFPKFKVGMLHGKTTKEEKEKTMQDFSEGKIDILVATSMIEVGISVANATMIVIEGAERFGLAQLHQLRGRVLRSSYQAYCFLFTDSENQKAIDRLKALREAKNGFELSEMDLKLRGSGRLYGEKQWGISDLGMEAIKNIKMVEAARTEAEDMIKKDPDLKEQKKLKSVLKETTDGLHFE